MLRPSGLAANVNRMAPDQTPQLPSIYDLDLPATRRLLRDLGEPSYRADQLWQWLYVHLARDVVEMTNLPARLRSSLAVCTQITTPHVSASLISADGETRKDALTLSDGQTIEAVLMRYERRRTACISTQAGCSVGCTFCATGQMGFRRDLTTGEIVAQVIHFARILRSQGDNLTNVVLMGMGEPLLNYDASLAAVRRLTSPLGFRLGQRRVTLSTVGIPPAIRRLAAEGLEIRLAISLHAATDALRDQLVPMNRRYPLDELIEACHWYVEHSNRRVSFEWALIAGVNDGADQARALASRLIGLKSHVNLIPLNPVAGYRERPSSHGQIEQFAAELERQRIAYSIRTRRGADIHAGCGQLAARPHDQPE